MAEDKKIQALRTFIAKEGLKNSRQREIIAQVFFESTEHIRVEELLQRVGKESRRSAKPRYTVQ